LPDDYRLTAAISIVKWVIQRYENGNSDEKPHSNKEPSSLDQGRGTPKTASSTQRRDSAKSKAASRAPSRATSNVIPVKALTLALEVCRDFLRCKGHLDIDEPINKVSVLNMFTYSVSISELISVIVVSTATKSFWDVLQCSSYLLFKAKTCEAVSCDDINVDHDYCHRRHYHHHHHHYSLCQ